MPLEIEHIELDEKDLGLDVTSSFNEKPKAPFASNDEEIEVELEDTIDNKAKEKKEEEVIELDLEEPSIQPEIKGKEEGKQKGKDEPKEDISVDYKSVSDYLIESGVFSDFEGREEYDYSEDGFKELLKEQALAKAKEEYEKLTEDLSEDTVELIEFFKNGGNLSELAQIESEIQDWETADVADEDIAEQVIRANYSQKGKSKDWITKHIARVKDEGSEAFQSEAEESKTELANAAKEDKKRQIEAVKQAEEKRAFQINQFNQSIAKTVNSDESFTKDSERKKLIDFLSLNKKLKNGQVVNELQIKLYEVQNDPKKYIELGKFLQDIDGYKSKVEKKATTQAAKKTFLKLKDRSSTSQVNSQMPSTSSGVKTKSPFAI